MKWKPEVTVKKQQKQYQFQSQELQTKAAPEGSYIVEAIEKGMTDDKELVWLVMKKENTTEVMANFRLAQFVPVYGDYISNNVGHMIIAS